MENEGQGQSTLPPSGEQSLPPVEMGTETEPAVSAAAAALQQVKAAEVQSLAEVLTQVNGLKQEMTSQVSQLTSALESCNQMKAEMAAALAEIQAQKEALKKPAETPQNQRRNLGRILP